LIFLSTKLLTVAGTVVDFNHIILLVLSIKESEIKHLKLRTAQVYVQLAKLTSL